MASLGLTVAEELHLPTVSYPTLKEGSVETHSALSEAFKTFGAVAIVDVPNFSRIRSTYFQEAIRFAGLPLEEKNKVKAGGLDDTYSYIGWNTGVEAFKGKDGVARPDVSKSSYYAIYPDHDKNKWHNAGLRAAYLDLAKIVHDVGENVMRGVGMLGEGTVLESLDGAHDVGRMLHYTDCLPDDENPHWCGPHRDHGLITGLTLPEYRVRGEPVEAPSGAGLMIEVDGEYRHVVAPKESILYQIGDFGQLLTGDEVEGTRHLVNKPETLVENLERHTFALFFDPPLETRVREGVESVLTSDPRYSPGVTFNDWHLRSLEGYEASGKKKADS